MTQSDAKSKDSKDEQFEQLEPKKPSLARALYTYIGVTADELDFRRNDLLEVLSDLGEVWWYARRQKGGKTGYVPCNYVLLTDNDVTGSTAWFEVGRRDAEKLLLLPGSGTGTYLIRPSSIGHYALSVRVHDKEKPGYYFIKHYKINMASSGGYYITRGITFLTMNDLLGHYKEHADGMPCKLTEPCRREYNPPKELSDMEVSRECIRLTQRLGSGSFSEVFLAVWNNTMPVAVKTMKQKLTDPKRFIFEAQILLMAWHPNVVQIMGVCTIGEPIYIVTELMINGCLLDYLRKDSGSLLNIESLVPMMIQIAEAMSFLDTLGIVHRDLRAANVLVGDSNLVKVADFGLARQVDKSGIYTSNENGKFPAKWTPPEAAMKCRFSTKSDVWSFGILMWEIITYGGAPYHGLVNREVLEFVSKGYRMPNPQGGHVFCDGKLYHIMCNCWCNNPDHRPTFGQLKSTLTAYIGAYKA